MLLWWIKIWGLGAQFSLSVIQPPPFSLLSLCFAPSLPSLHLRLLPVSLNLSPSIVIASTSPFSSLALTFMPTPPQIFFHSCISTLSPTPFLFLSFHLFPLPTLSQAGNRAVSHGADTAAEYQIEGKAWRQKKRERERERERESARDRGNDVTAQTWSAYTTEGLPPHLPSPLSSSSG